MAVQVYNHYLGGTGNYCDINSNNKINATNNATNIVNSINKEINSINKEIRWQNLKNFAKVSVLNVAYFAMSYPMVIAMKTVDTRSFGWPSPESIYVGAFFWG